MVRVCFDGVNNIQTQKCFKQDFKIRKTGVLKLESSMIRHCVSVRTRRIAGK